MFSEIIKDLETKLLLLTSKNLESGEILATTENGSTLSVENAWHLLNINSKKDAYLLDSIVETSRTIKTNLFHGKIYSIVPLYVSSYCQEHCVYCNYRAGNRDKKIERVRLTNAELEIEVEFLAKKGFRAIELVYATDPFTTVNDVSHHIGITSEILSTFGGGIVGINARPYLVEDYRRLKNAGLDFVVLWQETYDEIRYKELHPGKTEKRDFFYRLNAPERMIQAGIENIGLGVLSGLHDWRKDWYLLIHHVAFLLETYKEKIKTIILGIPRLKPAFGALLRETPK